MKKYKNIVFVIFLIIIFNSCQKEKDYEIIKDGELLEFRDNFPKKYFYKRLIIIEPNTKEFIEIQRFINGLRDFKQVVEVDIQPNYTIIGNNLKIFISIDEIYIERINNDGKIIKLLKKSNPDNLFKFRFSSNSKDWIYDFGNIYGKGEFRKSSYTFCSLAPIENEYEYKVGDWTFWNLERKLIAKGNFKTETNVVKNNGGCDYDIITSKIDDHWSFYIDDDIDKVNLLYNIESSKKINFLMSFN